MPVRDKQGAQRAAQKKAWRIANRDKQAALQKAWAERNREQRAQYAKAYYEVNRDRLLAGNRAWRRANPEKVAAKSKAWLASNPERNAAQSAARCAARRAAKLQRTPPWADLAEIRAVYDLAAFCNQVAGPAHVDHELPLQGELVSGLHVHYNLQVLPAAENTSKGNKLLPELA
jgi:hypothetical protein